MRGAGHLLVFGRSSKQLQPLFAFRAIVVFTRVMAGIAVDPNLPVLQSAMLVKCPAGLQTHASLLHL